MNTKKVARISLPLLLVALAMAFGLWQWQNARAMETDLQSNREKAYYSALDGLMNLETDLSKVLIAKSAGQQTLLLGRISSTAMGVAENLAVLPPAYGADADGLKFLVQLADYAQSLATAAAEGRMIGEGDMEQLAVLQQKCEELRVHLEKGANFVYDESLNAGQTAGIDYPSLLYDGPFSDGLRMGKAKGLVGGAVTAEEAIAIATAFVGPERVSLAQRAADTEGPVPTWGVSLDVDGVQVTVSVTRQAGKILWMAPETAGFSEELDVEECVLHAKAFLTSRGFGDMVDSFYQIYDGMVVVNFAAVQDEVVLYPDLAKVQVRMDTGAVIGLEANNYWMNHALRERLHPKLTEAEARDSVSGKLKVTAARVCVIPVNDSLATGRTEVLCWEFDGTYEQNRYLVYIDAETGEELEVLKVISSDGGALTI